MKIFSLENQDGFDVSILNTHNISQSIFYCSSIFMSWMDYLCRASILTVVTPGYDILHIKRQLPLPQMYHALKIMFCDKSCDYTHMKDGYFLPIWCDTACNAQVLEWQEPVNMLLIKKSKLHFLVHLLLTSFYFHFCAGCLCQNPRNRTKIGFKKKEKWLQATLAMRLPAVLFSIATISNVCQHYQHQFFIINAVEAQGERSNNNWYNRSLF